MPYTSTFPPTPLAYFISTGYTDHPTWHILIHMYLLWGGYVIYVVWSTSYLPLPPPLPSPAHYTFLGNELCICIARTLYANILIAPGQDSAQGEGGTGAWPALRLYNQNMENMCNVPHSHTHSVCGAPRVGGPAAHRESFIVYIICE